MFVFCNLFLLGVKVMQEPTKFFNFQLPYRTFKELKDISKRNDCPIAEVVRSGVDKVITEYNTRSKVTAKGN